MLHCFKRPPFHAIYPFLYSNQFGFFFQLEFLHQAETAVRLAAFHKLIEMPAVNQKLQLMGISDEEAQAFFDIMEGERHGGITIHQFLGK
jgi:hypothetical protein